MKHIQTPPKVNSLPNSLPTGGAQANGDEAWIQVGIPLAKVLSDAAEAMWRRELIDKADEINARRDLGANEQVRQLCAAISKGAK